MSSIDLSNLELQDKERRILEAAIDIFAEKGFSAATTNEIAKNAGVAEGTIFRYFKTKKDILTGIMVQGINLISGKLVISSIEKILSDPSYTEIRSVLRAIFYDRLKLLDSIFPIVRIVVTEALFHEDVREALYKNVLLRAIEAFGAFFGDMAAKGLVRNDLPPEVLLRSIMGNIGLLIIQRKLFADKPPGGDMEKDLDQMLDAVISGITPQKA